MSHLRGVPLREGATATARPVPPASVPNHTACGLRGCHSAQGQPRREGRLRSRRQFGHLPSRNLLHPHHCLLCLTHALQ